MAQSLCRDDMRILTYCNAGALATAGYGTALGVIRSAFRDFENISVYACGQALFARCALDCLGIDARQNPGHFDGG